MENPFQRVKKVMQKEEDSGANLIKLYIGEPDGSLSFSAREEIARLAMIDDNIMFKYSDNEDEAVPGFGQRFVQSHVKVDLREVSGLGYAPIPGIKPMIGLTILACRAKLVLTMSDPGYPTPKIWCGYLKTPCYSPQLNAENQFLFSVECRYCEKHNIRIINDGAYANLDHSGENVTLTEIAIGYPNLSFLELFSISKELKNGTGSRIGAVVGSEDFIEDFLIIKGNTDSGVVPIVMAGADYAVKNDQNGIVKCRQKYEERMGIVIDIMLSQNMKLVLEPKATFFSLWEVPRFAFGESVIDAEHFCNLLIKETGVVLMPFGNYVRVAVAEYPMEEEKKALAVYRAFEKAKVIY
jgi:aspartate/methionine/tyrosine aminotransferase